MWQASAQLLAKSQLADRPAWWSKIMIPNQASRRRRDFPRSNIQGSAMEALETLDEDILRLVLRFQLLSLDRDHTRVEVSRAIALAVQLASSEEQLDIAVQRSLLAPEETKRERRFERWVPAAERTILLAPTDDPDDKHDEAVDRASGNLADDDDDNDDEASGEEDCIICGSSAEPKVQLMGCRHWWCAKCLRNCIRLGLRDRTAWPPQCCEPLSEEVISWVQRPGWVQIWRQVREEQATPGGQRLYCPRPLCAEFIPTGPGARSWQVVELSSGMDSGEKSGEQVLSHKAVRCLVCNEEACQGCKRPAHPGRPCRMEDEDEQLMDLMDERGWASCPECNRIVELWDGCNHIRSVFQVFPRTDPPSFFPTPLPKLHKAADSLIWWRDLQLTFQLRLEANPTSA